ncbi:hypothetical protein GK047_13880 [Paenibacillus sp. SYP-B3998]|uniref:Uncharacterized protein n=1 Tax=Paenibacillus sp. SYP-B3998 TaxID=2678564 RepID=A0A6G4A0C1_9BACL|nr:hypothetical protein [Paenibacillus sp. SYP-B3998]NEW07097.1 hypothetical protein [Paenibacillus sp. SYP-B3998]
MDEMTDREFLSTIIGRINEIGTDVKEIKDRVDSIDRRLANVEDRLTGVENRLLKVAETMHEIKEAQIQQGEQIAGIAVTRMEHAARIRTLKLVT